MSRAAPPKKKTVRLAGDASKSYCRLLVEPAVESRSALIDRLVYELAPVPVRCLAIQNPEATSSSS